MCFSGMAKLTSAFNPKSHFKFWLIENKWFGLFTIEWVKFLINIYSFMLKIYHSNFSKTLNKCKNLKEVMKL